MSWECEIPEFYAESFPKARKRYQCCECTAPIEVGEKHLAARGKSEGEFWHERQHMLCRELCMSIREHAGECLCFGGLKEEWEEGDWHFRGFADEYKEQRKLMAGILRRERAARRARAR